MPILLKIKKEIFEIIHHFVFTSWAFVWLYLAILYGIIQSFLSDPFKYNPDFIFFAYQNSPQNLQNLWLQQVAFITVSFVVGFLNRNRLTKVNKLLAFFSFLVLLSLTMLFYPIIIGVLLTPKAI
ncbi:MAG: hypothetical protein H7196_04910 [candidate division SR1 bacterium]|nr:hypothetical protein [candidate division SR1 bacterium]